MANESLHNYYTNAFVLCHLHKFCTLTEYENMLPFELDVYSTMITEHAQKEKDDARTQESLARAIEQQGH